MYASVISPAATAAATAATILALPHCRDANKTVLKPTHKLKLNHAWTHAHTHTHHQPRNRPGAQHSPPSPPVGSPITCTLARILPPRRTVIGQCVLCVLPTPPRLHLPLTRPMAHRTKFHCSARPTARMAATASAFEFANALDWHGVMHARSLFRGDFEAFWGDWQLWEDRVDAFGCGMTWLYLGQQFEFVRRATCCWTGRYCSGGRSFEWGGRSV
jgi:hypothetical protein